MQLKDKVAIITGAGSGFGQGIAKRFAAEGAKVVVNDINAAGGERVAEEIRKAGGAVQFVKADVTRGADWAALVAAAQAKFGGLDIVVNNAGWTHRNKPYLEVTEAEFDKVYAVNVKSVWLSAMHVVPVFRKRGGGAFVNVASTGGLRPRPGLTVYNSSKGATIVMSKSMAADRSPLCAAHPARISLASSCGQALRPRSNSRASPSAWRNIGFGLSSSRETASALCART